MAIIPVLKQFPLELCLPPMRKALLFMALILTGCGLNKNQLEEEGYQVFEQYSIALKTPCRLEFDSTLVIPAELGNYVKMVCPQIFTDSTRESFYLRRLLEPGNTVHHFSVLRDSVSIPVETRMANQRKIFKAFRIENFEDVDVDGKHGFIYDLEGRATTSTVVFDEIYIYEFAVSSDTLRREKLDEVLRSVKFGTFD